MKLQTIWKNIFTSLFLFLTSVSAIQANGKEDKTSTTFELLPYGDMNTWMVRHIKESGIIGGNNVYFHEIARGDTLLNKAYKNTDSPWALSSVLAKVSIVTKASHTVYPEVRGNGFSARLETRLEEVKVLGVINMSVLASGTIFLGEMIEPITSTNNPMTKMVAGIPFTKRPKALQYDYKVVAGGKSIKATGFGGQKQVDVEDRAEVYLYLQHRWEDEKGNLYAKRVGTAWEIFDKTQLEWQNKHQLKIHYGDLTGTNYDKSTVHLEDGNESHYARNSKGVMVPVKEVGWGTADDAVTHLMLQFSSSDGGAYTGSIDNRLWIDNVGFVY